MKKINGTKLCCCISVLLLIGFIIDTILDYNRYDSALNSAPFYLWIIVNAICFIAPAIIVFVVGLVIKKKTKAD